jgi:hypothetical protein
MTFFDISATPFDPDVDYFEEQFALQNSWIFDVSPFDMWDDEEFPVSFKQQYHWLFESNFPCASPLMTLTPETPLSPEIFYDCVL